MKSRPLFVYVLATFLICSLLMFSCTGRNTDIVIDEKMQETGVETLSAVETAEGDISDSETDDREIAEGIGENELNGETITDETIKSVQVIDISPEEVSKIIEDDEDYMILDVRTEEEYKSGHIGAAVLLPVQELEARLDEIPMDIPVIVYCRSGSRSRSAAEILIANGFTMVYDMGGISSWTAEGYPVVVE